MTGLGSIDPFILLTVATILVLIIFILTIVQNFRRKPPMIDRTAIILLVMGLLFLTLLVFQGQELGAADWAQALLMIGLVLVTAFYASSAEKQADASVKMAKEMKEQRYTECLPILAPTIIPTLRELAANEFVAYEALVSGNGIKVMWRNVGKGVATNSQVSFSAARTSTGKAWFFPPRELGALEVGGQKEVDYSNMLDDAQLYEISGIYHPQLQAEYHDIYERRITTVQEFRVDEENRGTFLGELYFTINGRRLGKEVTRHD